MDNALKYKNREVFFDNLRGVLIILVLIGHFGGDNTGFTRDGNLFLQALECFIYIFHMPLMFFISGLFSKKTEKCRNSAFTDLLIPYFVFQLLYGIVRFLYDRSTSYLLNPFWPAPALWYLLALFLFRLVLHDFVKLRGALLIATIISILSTSLIGLSHIFALNRVFAYFVFFLFGYYADPQAVLRIKSCFWKKVHTWGGYCILTVVSLGVFSVIYYIIRTDLLSFQEFVGLIGRSKNTADIGIRLQYGPIISATLFIATIALSISLIFLLPEKHSWLTTVGQDTMPLYLSHMLIQLVYYIIQRKYFFFDSWVVNWLLSFIPVGLCVYLFSTKLYRTVFYNTLNTIKRWLVKPL